MTSPQSQRPDPQAVALVQAQGNAQARLTAAAIAAATLAVTRFDGWYSTADIKDWATALAALIEAYQRQMAAVTNAYLARMASLTLGRTISPVDVVSIDGLRTGVTHPGVYGRVADTYRYVKSLADKGELDAAGNLPDPLKAAIQRADKAADMDVALAARAQAQEFMTTTEQRPAGYRRVIHPELSKGGTCGLCVAASTRRYKVEELLPLHNLCHCTVAGIYPGRDPGGAINTSDLGILYTASGGTHRKKLVGVRYQVDQHGELGPVLTPEKGSFRSKSDAEADGYKPYVIEPINLNNFPRT